LISVPSPVYNITPNHPLPKHLVPLVAMADLRSNSVDYKRESESKAKWARGEAWGPGRAKEAHGAPSRAKPRYVNVITPRMSGANCMLRFPRTNQELGIKNAKMAQRHDIIDTRVAHSDSSGDEMPDESSVAPEPDADITYSFDEPKGPTHGSTVLSTALAKAVERFENTETEKLVKNEYEVLGEADVRTPIKKGGKRSMLADEEDDYEFI
jgi:hypothetical protein